VLNRESLALRVTIRVAMVVVPLSASAIGLMMWSTSALDKNANNKAADTVRLSATQLLPGVLIAGALIGLEAWDTHRKELRQRANALGPLQPLIRADLFRRNLDSLNLEGRDFTEAELGGASCRNANLRHTDFTGAGLTGANLSGSDIFQADFSQADLSGADFSRVRNFATADFTGAISDSTTIWPQSQTMPSKLSDYLPIQYSSTK
jgi:Pentapeptide repeats (8 copies)